MIPPEVIDRLRRERERREEERRVPLSIPVPAPDDPPRRPDGEEETTEASRVIVIDLT